MRTLDALHLASATVFDEAPSGVVMLSLDERICANASAMGMKVSPWRLADSFRVASAPVDESQPMRPLPTDFA